MIRKPLRPLAHILKARAEGGNPDAIERENLRQRHDAMRDTARLRAEGRLLVLAVMFLCGFVIIGVRMGVLAASEPAEPRLAASGASIIASRADLTDRRGRILATNMSTHSLYAHPQQMVDPVRAAHELARIFPDFKAKDWERRFTDPKIKFMWVKKKLSPEQKQAVHDIGEPGLLFGPREMRLYPNGALAAHVLGGASFGREGVHSAEVIGMAGVERYLDEVLRDPAREGAPVQLSLDLSVQAAAEEVLDGGMKLLNAKGAASVLMDVHSGEVISIVSLPDFDPNDRPRPAVSGDPSDSPLFNRAVQGLYELGSTFKIFTVAQAMELGQLSPQTLIDTKPPMRVGGHAIGEFQNKNYGTYSGFRALIESTPHANPHNLLGGHIRSFSSPADPLFFSHHAFIDKIWSMWQNCHDHDEVQIADINDPQYTGTGSNDGPEDPMVFQFPPEPTGVDKCAKDVDSACTSCVHAADSWCGDNDWDTTCLGFCGSSCSDQCSNGTPRSPKDVIPTWTVSDGVNGNVALPSKYHSIHDMPDSDDGSKNNYLYAPDQFDLKISQSKKSVCNYVESFVHGKQWKQRRQLQSYHNNGDHHDDLHACRQRERAHARSAHRSHRCTAHCCSPDRSRDPQARDRCLPLARSEPGGAC